MLDSFSPPCSSSPSSLPWRSTPGTRGSLVTSSCLLIHWIYLLWIFIPGRPSVTWIQQGRKAPLSTWWKASSGLSSSVGCGVSWVALDTSTLDLPHTTCLSISSSKKQGEVKERFQAANWVARFSLSSASCFSSSTLAPELSREFSSQWQQLGPFADHWPSPPPWLPSPTPSTAEASCSVDWLASPLPPASDPPVWWQRRPWEFSWLPSFFTQLHLSTGLASTQPQPWLAS